MLVRTHPFLAPIGISLLSLFTALSYVFLAFIVHPSLEDDSFIYYRYVDNLLAGGILSYNIAEQPTQGVSSLLYTALLLLMRIIFSINSVTASLLIAVIILSAFFFLFYNHLLYSRAILPVKLSCLIIAIIVMLDPSNQVWFRSGMEAPLYAFLLVVPFFIRSVWVNWTARFIFLLLISSARPEGFLFASAISLCFIISDFYHLVISGKRRDDRKHIRIRRTLPRVIFSNVLCVLISSGIVLVVQHLLFGSFLPNTVSAKSGSFITGLSLGFGYFTDFAQSGLYACIYISLLAATFIVCILCSAHKLHLFSLKSMKISGLVSSYMIESFWPILYLFVSLLSILLFSIVTGGDGLQMFRFYSHSALLVICAAVVLLESFSPESSGINEVMIIRGKHKMAGPRLAILGLFGFSAVISLLSLFDNIKSSQAYWYKGLAVSRVVSNAFGSLTLIQFPPVHATNPRFRIGRREERTELGIFLDNYLPKDSSLALSPAGKIPYFLGYRRKIIDMLGLNDRFIALNKLNSNSSRYVGGHGVYNDSYLISRNPDYMILGSVYEDDFVPYTGYLRSLKDVHDHLSSQAVDEALFRNSRFLSRYGVEYVGPIYFNNARWFYPLISRRATHKLASLPLVTHDLEIRNQVSNKACGLGLLFSSGQFYLPPGSYVFRSSKSAASIDPISSLKSQFDKEGLALVVDVLKHVDGRIVEVIHPRPEKLSTESDFLVIRWMGGTIELNVYAEKAESRRKALKCGPHFPNSLYVHAW